MAAFAFLYWLTDGDILAIMAGSAVVLLIMLQCVLMVLFAQYVWRKCKSFWR